MGEMQSVLTNWGAENCQQFKKKKKIKGQKVKGRWDEAKASAGIKLNMKAAMSEMNEEKEMSKEREGSSLWNAGF